VQGCRLFLALPEKTPITLSPSQVAPGRERGVRLGRWYVRTKQWVGGSEAFICVMAVPGLATHDFATHDFPICVMSPDLIPRSCRPPMTCPYVSWPD
jgi:hypothetical protein